MALLAIILGMARLAGSGSHLRLNRMQPSPVTVVSGRLLILMAFQAEIGRMASPALRRRSGDLTAVSPKPGRILVRCRHPPLMTSHAEVLHMACLAGLRLLLGLAGMKLQPPLRMGLIALMAVGAEQPVMTPIALSRRTPEFRLVFCQPSELMRPLDVVALGTEALGMAYLAVQFRLLELLRMGIQPG